VNTFLFDFLFLFYKRYQPRSLDFLVDLRVSFFISVEQRLPIWMIFHKHFIPTIGPGESGKSTIAKQMKIIHMKGFTKEEKMSYKSLIYMNTFSAIKTLCKATQDLNVPIEDPKLRVCIIFCLLSCSKIRFCCFLFCFLMFSDPNSNLRKLLVRLWKILDTSTETSHRKSQMILRHFGKIRPFRLCISVDPSSNSTTRHNSMFHIHNTNKWRKNSWGDFCFESYIEAVQRLAKPDYIPDEQDVLRSRVTTTGIIETVFEVDKARFRYSFTHSLTHSNSFFFHFTFSLSLSDVLPLLNTKLPLLMLLLFLLFLLL
jgi:hypothetical protein